jgi:hypothetical protein
MTTTPNEWTKTLTVEDEKGNTLTMTSDDDYGRTAARPPATERTTPDTWQVRNVPNITRTLAADIARDLGVSIGDVLTAALHDYGVTTRAERTAIQEARLRVTSRG